MSRSNPATEGEALNELLAEYQAVQLELSQLQRRLIFNPLKFKSLLKRVQTLMERSGATLQSTMGAIEGEWEVLPDPADFALPTLRLWSPFRWLFVGLLDPSGWLPRVHLLRGGRVRDDPVGRRVYAWMFDFSLQLNMETSARGEPALLEDPKIEPLLTTILEGEGRWTVDIGPGYISASAAGLDDMSDLSGDYLESVGALPARLLALAEAIEARGEPRGGANPTWLKRWIYPDPGRTLRPLIRLTVWLWQFLDRLGYFVFWFAIGALGFMLGLWLLIGAAIALLYALGWLPPL